MSKGPQIPPYGHTGYHFFALCYMYLDPYYLVFYGLNFGKETLLIQRANFSLSRAL